MYRIKPLSRCGRHEGCQSLLTPATKRCRVYRNLKKYREMKKIHMDQKCEHTLTPLSPKIKLPCLYCLDGGTLVEESVKSWMSRLL